MWIEAFKAAVDEMGGGFRGRQLAAQKFVASRTTAGGTQPGVCNIWNG